MKLEIAKMLVLSTSHLTEKTAKALEEAAEELPPFCTINWAPTFTRDEGYVWYVGEENPVVAAGNSYPEEFAALFSLAMENGCNWLMFDRDGDTVDNLPTYEW
jgi:hypothetical protein